LLKGLQTGKVAISTMIMEESYVGLTSDTRYLYIIEPFAIYPDEPLYILPANKFNFDIKLLNHKGQFVLPQNRAYYKWYLENTACGTIRGFGDYTSSYDTCTSKLFAEDTRIEEFNTAATYVHVVHPTAIELGILEIQPETVSVLKLKDYADAHASLFNYSATWKLVKGKYYIIKNDLMYEKNRIRYSESINFAIDSTQINELEYVQCLKTNEICLIYAKDITGDFQDLTSQTTIKEDYTVRKSLRIFPTVSIEKFSKNIFTLPYLGYFNYTQIRFNDTNRISSQELRLIVQGGTGHYIYYSGNDDVIQIEGQVLYGKLKGKTVIRVEDSEIPTNYDTMAIEVVDLRDFTYLEERQEVELGNSLYVAPIGLTESGRIFTNCTDTHVELHSDRNIRRLQNGDSVVDFLENNQDLVREKLKFLNPKDDTERAYLLYAKLGVCSIKQYLPDSEGYVNLPYYTTILDKKNREESHVISTTTAKAYVYTEITLTSPRFDDYFTKELLGRLATRFDYLKTFIVAPYSGVQIKFNGGIASWERYRDDYIETFSVIEKERIYSLNNANNITVSGRNKDFYLECHSDNLENDIQITVSNKQSSTLLRPGISKVTFTLGCYRPASLSIYLILANAQKDNNISIYDIPQSKGIVYYERINTVDIARVYAFDENKRMFFNITSLAGHWIKENAFSLVSDSELTEYSKNFPELEANINKNYYPEFIHSNIKFANFTTQFDLTYVTNNQISHYATIQVIDIPILVPQNQTLYYYYTNFADLKIEGGSGDYKYELSDNLLVKDDYSNRVIRLKPKSEGVLRIRLRDNKIPVDHQVEAIVYISKIKRIELLGGGLLMVNNTSYLNFKVYDNFDRVFSQDQVNKMSIKINEVHLYSDKLELEILDDMRIKVKGLATGYYVVSVSDTIEGVTSNTVHLEVFPKIEVFPPYLLMIPGSSYTLSIRGGPSKQEYLVKKFKMLDNQIASVLDREPEVSAHLIGKTYLTITISIRSDYNKLYRRPEENEPTQEIQLATETVPVRVEFPDTVDVISAHNRVVYTGSTIRLLAAFKKDDETFTYAIGPYNYEWSIDNTIVARMKVNLECKQDKQVCYRKDGVYSNSIGAFIKTEKEGEIEAKLNIGIKYPSPYEYTRPYLFSKTEKIKISDKIFLEMFEFYEYDPTKSGLYLLPPQVEHEMHINKDNNEVKYTLVKSQESNNIEVSESGRLVTRNKGLSYISIDRNDKVSNRPYVPVVVSVWVTDFYSLFIEKSHQLIDMEMGQIAIHKIVLQHEYGLLFAERLEGLPLRAVESHPKVAKCELIEHNSKIKIIASSRGETNIILFNPESRKIYDVVKITVYSTLAMPETVRLNIGATVELLAKDRARKEYLMQNSEWIVDNPNIVSISAGGTLTALKEGNAKVYLVSKDGQKEKVSTTIAVSNIKQAEAEGQYSPSRITDIRTDQAYKSEYK
jgi:hypothetical protein